jgi:GT2 family glycosyltransferase
LDRAEMAGKMTAPKVSIVVNTWSPKAKPYLDLCIESIRNLNYPQEQLDVVLVGRKSYQPEYEGVKTVAPDSDEFGNELGQNFGVAVTDPSSDYLFLINDDVFLTKNCVKNLVDMCAGQNMLLTPISPCDNFWKYTLHFVFNHEGEQLALFDRFYRYEQLEPYFKSLMNADSIYPQGALQTDMICAFALFLPRSTWNMIGPLDENFDTGQSDYDYCLRARALNLPRVIALNSIAWHFGGATTDGGHSDVRREKNTKYFQEKWPGERL